MALVRHTTEWLIRKNNVPVFCILFIAYSIQYQLLLSLTNFRKKKRSGKKYHIVGGNAYQSKEDSNDVDWTLNKINSLLISPAFHTRICIILILRNINLILVYLWRKYSRRHLTRVQLFFVVNGDLRNASTSKALGRKVLCSFSSCLSYSARINKIRCWRFGC